MKGTVRKRESGNWQWQFTSSFSGKRRHYSKGGYRTRKDAQAALSEALAAHGRGTAPTLAGEIPQLEAFVECEWLPVLGGLKPSTRSSYEWLAKTYVLPTMGALKLTEISPGSLASLYVDLRERGGRDGRGLSESTVHKVAVVLGSILGHGVELGYLSVSPSTKVPRRMRPRSRRRTDSFSVWTAAEAQRFLVATASERLHVAWALFLGTGMRRGEVAGLRWADVDLDRGVIEVQRNRVSVAWAVEEGTTKSDRGRRITLDQSVRAILRTAKARTAAERLAAGPAWVDDGNDLVLRDECGRPLHPETLTKAFNSAVARAGVPKVRLHDLRHTHATLLLADGVPAKVVQERLGHSSIGITLDLYGHVTAELEQHAADRIGAILSAPGSATSGTS